VTAGSAEERRGATLTASLWTLSLCAAIFTIRYAAPVLLPLVLSVLLFYTLDPVVSWLHRRRVPRMLASTLVVLSLVGAVAVGGYAIWPQFEAVVDHVPDAVAQLRRDLRIERRASKTTLERVQDAATAIDAAAADAAPAPARTPGVTRVEVRQSWRPSDWLWISGIGLLGFAGQAVTVLFLTLFLLNEGDAFKRKLVRHVETTGTKRAAVRILDDISTQMSRFIYVQIATASAVAVVTGLALWWLGLKQPAVWGLFAGVLNVVPYFGPLVVSAVLAAVGLLQFGTISGMLLVAGVALAITSIEGMILTPHLLSRASSLNHVAIFGAIAFWSWAWGTPGMLLAVPLLMVCKSISDHVDGLSGLADFLGNGEPSPRPARARSIAR
jgi:predicted PurR-regulated permease PerM